MHMFKLPFQQTLNNDSYQLIIIIIIEEHV